MKFKSFGQFIKDNIYVVELRTTGLKKPFLSRDEANKYWDEQENIRNEPKMHNISIEELPKFLKEEDYKVFMERYELLFKEKINETK